jgi:hypothetical protein
MLRELICVECDEEVAETECSICGNFACYECFDLWHGSECDGGPDEDVESWEEEEDDDSY